MKNEKGITLIALVITIIVLLILAGVSIAMLTGDNGLLTKSKESAAASAIAAAKDEINLIHQEAITKWLDDKYNKSEFSESDDTFLSYFTDEVTKDNGITANDSKLAHGCTIDAENLASAGKIEITYDNKTTTGTVNADNSLTWTQII